MGLIQCLSGASFFFFIGVIIFLRRQFQKPEKETGAQHPSASKEIELQTPSNPTEDQPSTPKTPSLPPASKVWVRITTVARGGEEVHRLAQLPEGSRLAFTYEPQETTLSFSPHRDGSMGEMDRLKSGEEVKHAHVKEEQEHHTAATN